MKNKMILGDAFNVMKNIPDESIDLIITSPQYNLGNGHHTGNIRHNPYQDNLPENEYQSLQIKFLDEAYRITKHKGSLLYNHKNRIKQGRQISPYRWIFQTQWIDKQELVWFNRSQNFDKRRFYPMTERVYWLVKSPETDLINTINHHDLFKWKAEGTDKEHKRAFPKEMVKDLLSCFPNAKTILDPFSGSGTTAIACIELNKNYICIEKDPKYYDLSVKRIETIIARGKIDNLFPDEVKSIRQEVPLLYEKDSLD